MQPVCDATDAGELFTAYRDRIRRYILGMVRDPAEAEDLTQETFLRAHRRLYLLRHPEAVGGWLYRIATHVCLDRLRQRKPQDSIDEEQTFLRAHRRLYLLRHPEAVGGWLYRIATHVCLDRLRQRKPQDSIDEEQ